MEETTRDRLERGRRMMERVNPGEVAAMFNEFGRYAADFEELALGFVFADVYDRDVLSLRDCQLVRLAALTALGTGPRPLRLHANAALDLGFDRTELVEILIQLLPYVGFPRVVDALSTVQEVLDERHAERTRNQ